MLNIQVNVTGTTEARIRFEKLGAGLHNFKKPMSIIGKELTSYYSGQVYSSQGGVLGLKWPTLAASTVAYKLKHYPQYATTPLIRTGEMQKSYKSEATNNSVTISNDAPYFKYHQSSAERTKIPRRATMAINDSVKSIVESIIEADIALKMKGA